MSAILRLRLMLRVAAGLVWIGEFAEKIHIACHRRSGLILAECSIRTDALEARRRRGWRLGRPN